jgi:hypothetical protein
VECAYNNHVQPPPAEPPSSSIPANTPGWRPPMRSHRG